MADPKRGEIWLVDLGIGEGHEQFGRRPVLVVSDDAFNSGLSGLVMVVPLTSRVAKSKAIPAHVPVVPPEGGLKVPSVLLLRPTPDDQQSSADEQSMGDGVGNDHGPSGGCSSFVARAMTRLRVSCDRLGRPLSLCEGTPIEAILR